MIGTQGLGLSGGHRTGKTTLARLFAEKHGIPFVYTSASETWKRMGLDPAERHPFALRLRVQQAILEDCRALYAAQRETFITDRTPLDFLGYTYADINGRITEEERALLHDYERECFATLNLYFRMVVIVQPGIPIVEEPGKAVSEPAYIDHLNHLMIGLSNDDRMTSAKFYIRKRDTSIESRIKALEWCMQVADQSVMDSAFAERERLGMAIH